MFQHYRFAGLAICLGACAMLLSTSPLPAGAQPAPVPDFSGPWGRNLFNLEPPDTGPGPLVNLRRLGADAGRSVVDGDPIPLVGDYSSPILKPEAAAIVKHRGEESERGHDIPDPSNQCGAWSPPFLFSMQQGMQLIQRKDDIVILYTQNAQVRRVRLNSPHPHELRPTHMGDSVGHYEGETLIVDTIGIKPEPYTVVDRFGTPQSEAMHVIERYRLIGAGEAQAALDRHANVVGTTGPIAPDPHFEKALRVELTVEDPKVFTQAWKANVTYRRVIRGYNEGACAENNVDMFHSGDLTHVPKADRADF
jgi:hypothetical protein